MLYYQKGRTDLVTVGDFFSWCEEWILEFDPDPRESFSTCPYPSPATAHPPVTPPLHLMPSVIRHARLLPNWSPHRIKIKLTTQNRLVGYVEYFYQHDTLFPLKIDFEAIIFEIMIAVSHLFISRKLITVILLAAVRPIK